MIKIFLTILVLYLLYYAGNIVYDLFLKKDPELKEEEAEEYALTTFSEIDANEIKSVSIDDVEQLNTPNSFNTKEIFSSNDEEPDEPHDLEHWRKKFESEQDIDDFKENTKIKEENQEDAAKEMNTQNADIQEFSTAKSNDENTKSEHKKEDPALKLKQQFNHFLSLAETQVQVLSDRDGFKVYHSMI
ncbi:MULTISPECIES: hypothetical protein [Weeksellaceae]|uniref:Uncharacterized protein n=3 Tax=Chryseobacterium TaxID=59732 RepID=A0AAD0YIZ7_9FLAO|nr:MULTISPECIES: hypothetical protein [Weeksellaceae]MCT4319231.1 hypothetical protein [Elizabethkingia anophelis]AZA87586.1 hypothetical protein EG349_12685 [Chryseobacterium shandongense]AZA96085.1 hypothetical protein EG353_11145 [Chryseobacterium shandongense]MDV3547223.1 hypothetical protein [Elizabethkingia anophelis]MDV3564960.1 hypothetical protein [Elizabethkingia anophelis]